MGSSIPFEDVIAFGSKLTSELGLDESVDTTARWMVHHLAELMVRVEKAPEAERAARERECFDAILLLWRHRASIPGSRRPLASFDEVFRVLEEIGDHTRLWYFARGHRDSEPGERWLDLAAGIDHSARELIRWCLAQAALQAADHEQAWLNDETARALDDGSDLSAVRSLLEGHAGIDLDALAEKRRVDELTGIRDHLNILIELTDSMRGEINEALRCDDFRAAAADS